MSKKQIQAKPKAVSINSNPDSIRKLKISLGLIIAAFTFMLYAQSIAYSYTMDDHPVTDKNKYTTMGIAGIPTLMKTDYWYGFKEEYRGPVYRPASLILFAVEWQFFPNQPHVYHLMNVLIYAVSCLILFLLFCIMFDKYFDKLGALFAFVCSMLYAAHPIHTEVVNNIKSLDEILCFLFGILGIYFVVKAAADRFSLNIILGSICFFLTMLSKETGITFLIVIPLTAFVFTELTKRKLVIISLAMVGVAGIYLLIRGQVLQGIGMNTSNSYLYNSLVAAPDIVSREATACYVLLRYIWLLIFPMNLTCDYNFAMIPVHTLSDIGALAGIVVNMALGIFALMNLKKKSVISYGILFYFITMAPVSNIFFLNGATMAERFMYTPSLGFCVVLTFVLFKILKTEKIKNKIQNVSDIISHYSKLMIVVSIIIGLYSIRTVARSMDWKDNYTIFKHDAEVSENSATVHYLLGRAILNDVYPNEKNAAEKGKYLDTAIVELNKANAIFDKEPNYHYYLGVAYDYKGDYGNAIKQYETAMGLYENYHLPSAELFVNLGMVYFKTNQIAKDIGMQDSAIKYDAKNFNAYKNKGDALFQMGRYLEAVEAFGKAVELNPEFVFAYRNMGTAYANLKEYEKALECYHKVLELDKSDVEVYKFVGMIYQIKGDSAKAKENFEKANNGVGGKQ